MADIDPNEPDGFSAMLAQAVGKEPATAEEDPDPDEPAHVPVDEVDTSEEEVEDEEDDDEELSDEERILEEKFGGDHLKMARSYQELERKLGEIGNARGQEARERQELEQRLAQLESLMERQSAGAAFTQTVDEDWVQDVAMQSPGDYAWQALQTGQTAVYEAIMDAWFEDAPRAAARFEREVEWQSREAKLRDEFNTGIQPAQQVAQRDTLVQAWSALRPQLPEGADELAITRDIMEEATRQKAAGFPQFLDNLQSGDVQTTTSSLENLYRLSQSRKAGELTRAKEAKEREAATKHAAAKRRASAVVRPSAGGSGEDDQQSNVQQFKKSLVESGLDIDKGLTYDRPS